jgi:hypothetical protein
VASGRAAVEAHLGLAAGFAAATVLLAAGLYRRILGSGLGEAAALLLLLFSPAQLRPFEQYPLACLVLVGSGWMPVRYAQSGGFTALLLGAGLGLGAVFLHLSSWFLLGPILVFLALFHPSRRRALLGAAFAVVALFLVSTLWPQPGMWDLFDQPHVYFGEGHRWGASAGPMPASSGPTPCSLPRSSHGCPHEFG